MKQTKIVLRDVLESDLPTFFDHQRDPAACRMAAFTPRDRDAFMTHWQENILGNADVTKKAILFEGDVVGNIVGFERDGRREVGYWIGREHWGRGIATEALSQLLRSVPVRPLYAFVAKRNVASIRVLEKCGFAVESETRGSARPGAPVVEEFLMKLE